jgi:hypothetical protein
MLFCMSSLYAVLLLTNFNLSFDLGGYMVSEHIMLCFQSKALHLIVDTPWYVPNMVT